MICTHSAQRVLGTMRRETQGWLGSREDPLTAPTPSPTHSLHPSRLSAVEVQAGGFKCLGLSRPG